MRVVLFLWLILIAFHGNTQPVLETNKRDEFKGFLTRATAAIPLTDEHAEPTVQFNITRVDSVLAITLAITSSIIFTIHKGDELILKSDSGMMISFFAYNSQVADYTMKKYGTIWHLSELYFIREPEFEKVNDTRFTKFRFYSSMGYNDCDILPSAQTYIADAFKLVWEP